MGIQGTGGSNRPVESPRTEGPQQNPQGTQGSNDSSKPPATDGNRPPEGGRDTERPSQADRPPPPPPTPATGDLNANLSHMFDSNTALQSDLSQNIMMDHTDQTSQADKQANTKQSERSGHEMEQTQSRSADRAFMRAEQDMNIMRQRMFSTLLTQQQKTDQHSEKNFIRQNQESHGGERAEDPSLKQQQFFRARNGAAPGLQKDYSDAPWKQTSFKNQLPPGYNAFMQDGPRGRQLHVYTQRNLKGMDPEQLSEALMEEQQMQAEEGKEAPEPHQMTQSSMAYQKKLAKQMGLKEGAEEAKENEEILNELLEGDDEVSTDGDEALNRLRQAMNSKMAKAKGKGESEEELGDMPWANFGEAIEQHTVLFSSAEHGESAQLVSQASFASAVIMGAALHIRLKGARLNYSGTSHHGLPIPSGDESLEMGAKQLVSGLERDMGQLGVESVFVNGQRFELANKDDERKLRELVKDNPDLWQAIENIREAIRESRFYRTCLGLTEESGGRA